MTEWYLSIVFSPLFWAALGLIAVALILQSIPASDSQKEPIDLTKWSSRNLWAVMVLTAFALSAIALFLYFELGLTIDGADDFRNLVWMVTALAAAPFVIWRAHIVAKQAEIAEDSLFNDKINSAAEDLAARRQVTRVIGKGVHQRVLSEWQDDLVKRAAAIDRLEGLANERPDTAPRIARMLSVYVRELSAELPAINRPEKVDPENTRDWASSLRPCRSDMEKAAQTLGRLKEINGLNPKDISIDLRGANLQGFDFFGLNFDAALLQFARLEGANLSFARLEGADLSHARLEGARLSSARLEGADLWHARLEGAILSYAWMERATLLGARLEGADLSYARMEGADLREARMEGAILSSARLKGAILWNVQFDSQTNFSAAVVQYAAVKSGNYGHVNVTQEQINSLFGDASVVLPDNIQRPAHWPNEDLEVDEFYYQWRAWQKSQGYTPK